MDLTLRIKNTVDVRKRNIQFDKPKKKCSIFRRSDFRCLGPNRTNWNKNQFQPGLEPVWNWFCVWQTEYFVQISDVWLLYNRTKAKMSKIRKFGFRTLTVWLIICWMVQTKIKQIKISFLRIIWHLSWIVLNN